MSTDLAERNCPRQLRSPRTPSLIVVGILAAVFVIGLISTTKAQDQEARHGAEPGPDLVAGLKATKGCLGVETANTSTGKSVIFAWFENRKACLKWYYSDMHQAMMDMVFTEEVLADHGKKRKPLSGVPASYDGPIMAVASLTYAKGKPGLDGLNMPISQIAIELYMPLTGGLHLGGRFAPDSMVVDELTEGKAEGTTNGYSKPSK